MIRKSCLAMALLMIAGCGTSIAPLVTLGQLEGRWRVLSTSNASVVACITITSGQISAWDQGCTGTVLPIEGAQSAVISGQNVIFLVIVTTSNDSLTQVFNMSSSTNGPLTGNLSTRSHASGLATSQGVLWLRADNTTP